MRWTATPTDETPNDYTMASFSIDRDKQRLIPFVKAALALNASLRLWGSPWTPPTWMKTTSGSDSGTACTSTGSTAFDGGCMKDDAQVLQANALYLAKWVQAYATEGIKIEAIHPQNEPGYATGYPSCLWSPALYHQVRRHLPRTDVRQPGRHRPDLPRHHVEQRLAARTARSSPP